MRRWLFGDQLGPHFLDSDDTEVLMIESRRVFERRAFHRQKAHLVLSAMRHRAAELGRRCHYLSAPRYRDGLAEVDGPLEVIQPTVGRRCTSWTGSPANARSSGCRPGASRPPAPTSLPGPTAGASSGC